MSSARGATSSRKVKHANPPAPPIPVSQSGPDLLRYVVLALAAFCLLGIFSTAISEPDFWWNLKSGEYIVQHHSLPVPDPFAYTTAIVAAAHPGEAALRNFNLKHEWLAQVVFYLIYAIGGFPAIVVLRAVVLSAFCGLAGLVAGRLSGNFYGGIAASFAAAWLAIEFNSDRPALATFFFVAVFVAVLELRRGLWILPVASLIWANCHGGFFLGWIILLAYCAETVPLPVAPWKRAADSKRLWLVTAISIAISGLNPNGFHVLNTLFGYERSDMITNLLEWHSPYLWGPPYAFDILLYASAAVLILAWRKVRLAHWLLYAAFAAASLEAFRNILLIGFLAPIMIAAYFPYRFYVPRAARWAAPAMLAIGFATGCARGSFFQLRVATWQVPVGAADYILAHHVSGPLFNTWELGGYLMWRLWPEQRVFIDGRALSASLNRDYRQILYNLNSDVMHLTGPRADLLNRYGIQAVVMNGFEYASGAEYPLALALALPPASDWKLVYDDPQALIFWKNPPAGTESFPDKYARVVAHMDAECATHIEHDPGAPACALTLAQNWAEGGGVPQALQMLRLYLLHAPERDREAEDLWRRLGGGALPR